MPELTLAQVYRRAAEVLDERGWHQGWYVDAKRCKVCILGAVICALGGQPQPETDTPAIDWADQQEDERFHEIWDDLRARLGQHPPTWNDRMGRTVVEVKAALLRAAEEAERRG